jgi:hypothetical protein
MAGVAELRKETVDCLSRSTLRPNTQGWLCGLFELLVKLAGRPKTNASVKQLLRWCKHTLTQNEEIFHKNDYFVQNKKIEY